MYSWYVYKYLTSELTIINKLSVKKLNPVSFILIKIVKNQQPVNRYYFDMTCLQILECSPAEFYDNEVFMYSVTR